MLTIKRLFIVCNRETFAFLFLYGHDGVSGAAGSLHGIGGCGAPGWGIPVLVAGVREAAEPHPSIRLSVSSLGACGVSQAVNSRKLPGRHIR